MKKNVALLHGAGYAGGELVRILLGHPEVELKSITSRSFAGKPIWTAHPDLRGQIDLTFVAPDDVGLDGVDVVLIAAEHGKGVRAVLDILESGYEGAIIDLSADFRFEDPSLYEAWFGFVHPAPELLKSFVYGMPEINAPYPPQTKHIANPGCFATGLVLALWPVSRHVDGFHAAVTALTGASGSGATPKSATHYPTRDANLRAYKILRHQHLPEVQQILGNGADIAFVPVSGPWTRGIWGSIQIQLPSEVEMDEVSNWFESAYGDRPFIRLWKGELPELRYAARSPFCDIGWVVAGRNLVIGFAEDNLLKGAASQAIQNLNLLFGFPETTGLLPQGASRTEPLSLTS